jgi:SagB-type dehydrogenase family enzyme
MRSARLLVVAATAMAMAMGCTSAAPTSVRDLTQRYTHTIELDDPQQSGPIPLEQVLTERRSAREFSAAELDLSTIGQLLWAGQGTTDDAGHRTAPSAGATYPIELYALTATTFMHYLPAGHRIEQRPDTRTLDLLADAAFEQGFVNDAPTVLVIAGVRSRTAAEYGAVADDLMNREAGHVAQNILLQATALSLAAVPVGGFDPAEVARLLALQPAEEVLYLLPVGHPANADAG